MNINETLFKLKRLEPGEELVYYTGNLAEDRGNHDVSKNQAFVTDTAYDLCREGLIHIIQRKIKKLIGRGHEFEYTAQGV